MKKFILFLFIITNCSLLISNCFAQEWQWLNPYPTGNGISDIKFINKDTGWAVGGYGTIVLTHDGGDTWTLQKSGLFQDLYSVFFYNAETGYTVGNAILKTIDGGKNWIIMDSLTGGLLTSIFFTTKDTGYVVSASGGIYKTTDGALTWKELFLATEYLSSIIFTDKNTGIAIGDYGQIYKTTDGGTNWIVIESDVYYPVIGEQIDLFSVFFPDKKTGYITAWGYNQAEMILLKSSDGGNNWKIQYRDLMNSFLGIYFFDSLNGYGASDGVFKTTDGGKSWLRKSKTTGGPPFFVNDSTGYIANPFISKTTNGGLDWVKQRKAITTEKLNSLYAVDSNLVYIVGNKGIIIKTVDGGKNFILQNSGKTKELLSVFFINKNTGYTCGRNGTFLKTTDGGENWLPITINDSMDFNSIYFQSIDTGFVTCYNNLYPNKSILYKTVDGGNTWMEHFNEFNISLSSVNFVYKKTGIALAYDYNNHNSLVLKTTNEGNVWEKQKGRTEKYYALTSMYFIDSNIGYSVGGIGVSDGIIVNTIDGGNNWNTQLITNNNYLFSVYFLDSHDGYAIGYQGTIYQTRDAGVNWIKQNDFAWQTYNAVSFANKNTGYIIGEGGTILKTKRDSAIIINANELKIKNEGLGCIIVPNPVSELSVISYHLSIKNKVIIKIFDIAGRELSTLINGVQYAGDYNIKFNSNSLKNGVYLIKFETDNNIKALKFIINK